MPIGEPQVAIWQPQLCEEVVQLKAVLNNLDQYGAYQDSIGLVILSSGRKRSREAVAIESPIHPHKTSSSYSL